MFYDNFNYVQDMRNQSLLDTLYRLLQRAIIALGSKHEVARGSAYPLTGNFCVFGPFILRFEKFELRHLVKRHDFAVERGEFSGHVISRSEPLSLSLILPPRSYLRHQPSPSHKPSSKSPYFQLPVKSTGCVNAYRSR
jgi:hypothetical protein